MGLFAALLNRKLVRENKLTEYHQNQKNIKYHVACKANGDGCMDETKVEGVTRINDHEFEFHNTGHKIQEIREKKQEALKHDTLLPTWLEEFKQYEHIKTLERRVVVERIDHMEEKIRLAVFGQ